MSRPIDALQAKLQDMKYAKTAQHTPGPWQVGPRHDGWLPVTDVAGNLVALADWEDADARLIAAAPELVAALQATLDTFRECIGHAAFSDFESGNHTIRSARAALAKAGA